MEDWRFYKAVEAGLMTYGQVREFNPSFYRDPYTVALRQDGNLYRGFVEARWKPSASPYPQPAEEDALQARRGAWAWCTQEEGVHIHTVRERHAHGAPLQPNGWAVWRTYPELAFLDPCGR